MDTRQFAITATLGVAVLCLAAVGWNLYGPSSRTPSPDRPGPADPAVDLMTPSPLGERVLGNDAAPVTVIEYASLTCSHCARFHEVTYPELKKRYVDTGKVKFIFREFPLDTTAMAGFAVARCAEKEKYFSMIEVLFKQQDKWAVGPPASPIPPLLAIAKQTGMTEETFNACLKNQTVIDGINWSLENGTKLRVKSTPTFFINGAQHSGALSIEDMEKIIEPLLKG